MAILQRKVLLIGSVLLVVIVIFFVMFLYRPHFARRAKIEEQISELKKQLKEYEAMAKDIDRLRKQVANLEDARAEFMSKIAPRSELLTTVRQLIKLAEPHQIVFVEIHPPGLETLNYTERPEAPVSPVPFTITVQGRYVEIGRFLEKLSNFPYYLRTPELEIIGKDDIRPMVEAKILLNIYASSLISASKL